MSPLRHLIGFCTWLHLRSWPHNRAIPAGIKESAAISQAIITGGAVAGSSFALFQTHPTVANRPLIEFDLALLLIPSLLLGTSIGKTQACLSVIGLPSLEVLAYAVNNNLTGSLVNAWQLIKALFNQIGCKL